MFVFVSNQSGGNEKSCHSNFKIHHLDFLDFLHLLNFLPLVCGQSIWFTLVLLVNFFNLLQTNSSPFTLLALKEKDQLLHSSLISYELKVILLVAIQGIVVSATIVCSGFPKDFLIA